jgi:flagella basal body P-ring formation protein FlgA
LKNSELQFSPMNSLCKSLLALTLLTASADGAEVLLREQAAVVGPVVKLGDVADVAAATPAELDALTTTPLMPAPASGRQEYLSTAQIRDLLSSRGLDMSSITLGGATNVAVGAAGDDSLASELAGPSRSVEDARAAATHAILQLLREKTGHQEWNVVVEHDAAWESLAARSGDALVVRGGKAPWTGVQVFELTSSGRPARIVARVERVETAAFAVRTIERGDLVGVADLELRPFVGELPPRAVASLQDAVGKEAVQTIRSDAIVQANQLRAPIIVRRGERVEVRVRSAGVVVRTYATASQDGSLGDLLMVDGAARGDRYAARVSGVRELEVFAAGTSAGDLTSTR